METLHELKKEGGEIVGVGRLAERRNVTKQAQSQLVKKMQRQGLVNTRRTGNTKIISLTQNGREIILDTPYGTGRLDSSKESNKRIHGISATLKPSSGGQVPVKWQGVFQDSEEVDILEEGKENDLIVARDRWVFRCHKNSVTLQNREGVSIDTDDVKKGFLKLSMRIREQASWLSGVSGTAFEVDRIELNRGEVAFEEDHQALLADAVPGLDLQDIQVYDDDVGQAVVKFDKSKAVPERETLTGVRAEEVAQTIERENRQLALNSEAVEMRHRWENELSLKDVDVVDTVERLSNLEQLQELVESNRDVIDSVIELARSNQNVLKQLSDKLESGGGYENPVQEKYVEFDEDPEFNTPFFHKDTGGLYAFRRDGSGCVKILSGEKVDKLS